MSPSLIIINKDYLAPVHSNTERSFRARNREEYNNDSEKRAYGTNGPGGLCMDQACPGFYKMGLKQLGLWGACAQLPGGLSAGSSSSLPKTVEQIARKRVNKVGSHARVSKVHSNRVSLSSFRRKSHLIPSLSIPSMSLFTYLLL